MVLCFGSWMLLLSKYDLSSSCSYGTGLIIIAMALFFYIWAANAAPLAGIASGVCGVGNTFELQSSDCDRIQANEAIIQGAPAIAVIIGIFGLVAVVTGNHANDLFEERCKGQRKTN